MAGNTAAFGGLIDKYEKLLFNIALRMVNNYDDARDITQTAFLKAYERLDSYDPRYKFFSWIYRIVVNESINAKTKAKRFTELDRDIPLHDRNPEQALVSDELSSKVQDAVVQLPPDYREVI
ncbi:MAG: sigma-70 family RNA polymerase sigma factor, partial [Candidatus Eisenbacteria bacterium]|nr:sigma-70 family RNA polymerase sigma factor [Candidatus Eisenbacteria bacterium]